MIKTALMKTFAFPTKSNLHLARKLWHAGVGSFGLFIYSHYNLEARTLGWQILTLALMAFTVEFIRFRWEFFNIIVCKMMAPFMRESEINGISGFPYYALGVGGSLLLFPADWAVLSVAFLVYADPASSAFGIMYGKDKILPGKSLQGFFACFAMCYLITFIYLSQHTELSLRVFVFSLLAGLVGALSELASTLGIDDNLIMPILSGLGLMTLNQIFSVL